MADEWQPEVRTLRQGAGLGALADTWPVRLGRSAVSAFTLPGDVYAGRVDPNSQEALQRAADLAGFVTLGSGAVPASADDLRMGIRAYHGSPYDFEKFDASKIGTGEGAQAYGHGLYFAENKGVAESYRQSNTTIPQEVKDALKTVDALGFDSNSQALQAIRQHPDWVSRWDANYPENAAAIDTLNQYVGHRHARTYEVSINAHPDEFLNWDAPLSEQPANVQKLAAELDASGQFGRPLSSFNATGKDVADRAMAGPNLVKTGSMQAERLQAAGIKGIRYKDAGSRRTEGGTHNYVVFDPQIVDIEKKYRRGGLTEPKTMSNTYHLRRGGSIKVTGRGNIGDTVTDIQSKLSRLGYDVGPVDGRFGKRTEAAVRAFQKDHDLRMVDGKVGPETLGALKAATVPLPRLRPETASNAAPEPPPPASGGISTAQVDPMRFLDPMVWGPQQGDQGLMAALLAHKQVGAPPAAPPDFSEAMPMDVRPAGSDNLDVSIPQHNADVNLRRALDAKIGGMKDIAVDQTPTRRFDGDSGLLASPVAGRTDRLPIAVPRDSYVVPADVVSGLGQGNTDAGAQILDQMFVPHMKGGGAPQRSPKVAIIAAGGEYMVHPQAVANMGGGDVGKGHRTLDKMVLNIRRQTINRMKTLPGPKP